MKKRILILFGWLVCHATGSCQDAVAAHFFSGVFYPEARVCVDTVKYSSLDLIPERLVLQEHIAEDTLTVVAFTAMTPYHLFSPSINFPGSWVERMSNGFPVVVGCDTFCMTVPSCDDNACTSGLFSDYQGFPLVPMSGIGDCAFVIGTKDTNDARVIVEGLGRAGASKLLRVTVYGYAMSNVPTERRTKYDPGYVKVSVTNAYYTRYLAGAPVFGPGREQVIGIVTGVVYRESGEDVIDVELVITFFT